MGREATQNIADRSQYKFGSKLALFMQFSTFFMTKAKHDKMKCLFQLYSFNYFNLNHKKSGRQSGDATRIFSHREKMLAALETVSVAISSPVLGWILQHAYSHCI